MKPLLCFLIFVAAAPGLLRAQMDLSSERLDMLDQRGYFTPGFKKAVRDLVDAQEALDKSRVETKKWNESLPALQSQSTDAAAKVVRLGRNSRFTLIPKMPTSPLCRAR